MKRTVPVATIYCLLMLTGCSLRSHYQKPQVSVPDRWTLGPARGTSTRTPTDDSWWLAFQDPKLNSLVERAIRRNLDLKLALERIEEARAARAIARSGYAPSVEASASAVRLRGGLNQGVIRAVPSAAGATTPASLISPFETNVIQGSLSASWELDVFRGIRSGVQAATAGVTAAKEHRRDLLVILLGDVGRAYAQLRGFQQRLEIAKKNIQTQQETLDLTKARADAGLAAELDVSRAAAQLESTRAAVPGLLSGIEISIHRLSVLLGEEPGALRSELEEDRPIPAAGPEVEVGLPSELLKRRPDIRRAEAELAAAVARVGEAKADLFPRFVLTGTAGRQATQLRDLTLGLGNFFSIGPGISLPLFTGGRIRSNIAVQSSRQRAALIRYEASILNALEEVQNALAQYSQEQERRDLLNQAVQHNRLSVDLALEQYRGGLATFLDVLEALRELYLTEDQLVQSQTGVATHLVALYRALGGGWNAGEAVTMNGIVNSKQVGP